MCTCIKEHLTTYVYRAVASTLKVVRPIQVVGQIACEGACVRHTLVGGSGGPLPGNFLKTSCLEIDSGGFI